eukprot:m.55622 g.55622  ORF g.55622 m.55622 type:complete len:414 (+) comp7616_c0_seq4:72-1313(+)
MASVHPGETKDVEIKADAPTELFHVLHTGYIKEWEANKGGFEYVMSEYLRMSGLYWCLTALDLLHKKDEFQADEVVAWVERCRHPDGGFSASPDLDPHVLYTLSAVQVLVSLDRLTPEVAEGAANFMSSQQLPDGSFQGDKWGEVDTRFSFCALACLALVNKLDAVNVDAAGDFVLVRGYDCYALCYTSVRVYIRDFPCACDAHHCLTNERRYGRSCGMYITVLTYICCCSSFFFVVLNKLELSLWRAQSCMNFDGGFGVVPGSESHSGQVYCCVGALAIAEKLHKVDADLLGWWLAERQLPSGGFNGRPEKLPDVCYSWWVLTSLRIIGRMHWIDADKLRQFILACQDKETGGFSDRPGDLVDPFHTLFGIAALSLLGDGTLKEINPIFCMPEEVIRRAVHTERLVNINPVV